MKLNHLVSYCLLSSLLLFSCNKKGNNNHSHPPSKYTSTIVVPAGDQYGLIPEVTFSTFFNVGQISNANKTSTNAIILGSRKSKNNEVNIEPIALFTFTIDTMLQTYVVALNKDEKLPGVGRDFNSFSLNNTHLKASIEDWFRASVLWENAETLNGIMPIKLY